MITRKYRIHPGIGIARVGNSNEYFVGPEAPGNVPTGPFRDDEGNLKRQAARFRVFEYQYDDGEPVGVREVVHRGDVSIRWSVHLCNRKAASRRFPPDEAGTLRNPGIDRERLIIDGGRQDVEGVSSQVGVRGSFLDESVTLGALRTDEYGRLVVLGGFGRSRSVPPNEPLPNFANNPGWHDDVSDGPVTATIQAADADGNLTEVVAEPAWIVVAPPSFAPGLQNVVTWYDQALNIATRLDRDYEPKRVSFIHHVHPILRRVSNLQWVNAEIRGGHSASRPRGDFLDPDYIARLADPSEQTRGEREAVFANLYDPNNPAGFGTMPQLNVGIAPDDPLREEIATALTPLQLRLLRKWSTGRFEADWTGEAPSAPTLDEIDEAGRPAALDRSAIEDTIGTPFYPGIEAGYLIARLDSYEAPFRIARRMLPGQLTESLAVPWQADFHDCDNLWWPAARPTEAFARDADKPHTWISDFSRLRMANDWWKLGVIVEDGNRFVETEREV